MCENCFNTDIYTFETQKDFDEFDTIFSQKCHDGKIEIIDRHKHLSEIYTYNSYRCTSCGEVWCLSLPEYAWRGFFLTEKQRVEHTNKIQRADRNRKLGCFFLIVFVALIALWKWLA